MTIEVRPFTPQDTESTWQVFHAAVHRTAAADYSAEQVSAWAPDTADLTAWRQRREQAHTFVVLVDGHVAGFGDVTDAGLVDMLFVHPDYAGQGLARLILEAVIRRAREKGLARLHTHASRTARPVFERLGFVTDGLNDPNWIRGHNLPNYDMHLDL